MNNRILYLLTSVVVIILSAGFASCGDDDDDDSNSYSSSSSKSLIGFWLGPVSKYQNDYFFFYDNGAMLYGNYSTLQTSFVDTEAKWKYDEETKLLSTTAGSFQWEVTLVDSLNWAGISLWGNKDPYTYKRADAKTTAMKILKGCNWVDSSDNSEWHWGTYGCNCVSGSKREDGDFDWSYGDAVQSLAKDRIYLYGSKNHSDKYDQIIIEHPYSYNKVHVIANFKDGYTTPYLKLNLSPKRD